jgi:hypothetical protein
MTNTDDISKLAFLLYPHIVKSQPDVSTIESLAERIRQVQTGLQPEDEFATTVCWLGNCAGIHRIDQAPMTGNASRLNATANKFHPLERLADDMSRQAVLARLGWTFVLDPGKLFPSPARSGNDAGCQ